MHGVLNPSSPYFVPGFKLLPTIGFGNKYCWLGGFDFYHCCGSRPDPACWSDGGFSFDNCCQSGGIRWQLTGDQARASPSLGSERNIDDLSQIPCLRETGGKARTLLALSEGFNSCNARKAIEWRPDWCESAGGRLRKVSFNWVYLTGECSQSFQDHIVSIGLGAGGENCSARPLEVSLQLCTAPECEVRSALCD